MDVNSAANDQDLTGAPAAQVGTNEKLLFWASFVAMIATAFGFVVRTQVLGDWQQQFNLTETQKGELFGVGLWPFAISIVLFSLFVDRIGYGKAMAFAFLCHVASAIITILTPQLAGGDPGRAYWILYIGTFIVALGNGTVEAVVNPVVATLFPREKTKWLNILHAGWPGGLVLGGIIAIAMGSVRWEYKVGLIFLPVVVYGVMMLGRHFPVNERVAAGVSYMDMLRQVGFLGALLVTFMIVSEVGRIFGVPQPVQWALVAIVSVGYGLYTRSLGQPLFIVLLLIMVPLATTELGTDSWITDLMSPEMVKLGFGNGGWLLVYTSLIMMVLRFSAGSIVHRLSPLGLLAASAVVAACGLFFLSKSSGMLILAAATIYGLGKTFFWPTMLGVTAEQFPRGGALTLNTVAAVGMLAVGVLGSPFLGKIQDTRVQERLEAQRPGLYGQVVGPELVSVFGKYRAIEPDQLKKQPKEIQGQVVTIQDEEKKDTLRTVAIFPCVMFACYLGLMLYFRSRGGYKPQILISEKEEELLMTGGAPAADGF